MHSYQTYGLGIHSDFKLPELIESDSGADIIVRRGEPCESTPGIGAESPVMRMSPSEILVGWKDVGSFIVRNGNEIVVSSLPGVEERVLRLYILGTCLGMVLIQRLGSVFHASVVALPQGAVAFVGEKGYGKSTMAAALHIRGNHLISDDLLVLDQQNGRMLVRPGFPQIKLWPDSVTAIGDAPESLPQIHPEFEKRARRIETPLPESPMPLRCVYFLLIGEKLEITKMPAHEALLALTPHWYGARFGMELINTLGLKSHFQHCMELAKRVPIFILRRPPSLENLSEIARAVEEHAASLD